MSELPRGLCIIINYYDFTKFPGLSEKYREGSYKDAENLKVIFYLLDFEIKLINSAELFESDVIEILEKNISNNKKYQAIVIAISSHGDINGVICSNGNLVTFKQIINKLNDFASLKEKPKLIFFDCCRSINNEPRIYKII